MQLNRTNTTQWYALRTKPRAEKKIVEELKDINVKTYLPLQKNLKQWSDRKKWVYEPLITSYVFVYMKPEQEQEVVQLTGAIHFVKFSGILAPIPDEQIEMIKMLISSKKKINVVKEKFEVGEKVQIIAGSLCGVVGEMIEYRGKHKLLIRLDTINQGLLVNVPLIDVEKVHDTQTISNNS